MPPKKTPLPKSLYEDQLKGSRSATRRSFATRHMIPRVSNIRLLRRRLDETEAKLNDQKITPRERTRLELTLQGIKKSLQKETNSLYFWDDVYHGHDPPHPPPGAGRGVAV
jgi:hypothetical protein